MLKAIAFGIATGAGVQGWRNWPADGPMSARSGELLLVVAVVCAFLAGLWFGRGNRSNAAVAVAHAEAHASANARQSVQVAVIVPGAGAGDSTASRIPTEAVSWFEGTPVQLVDSDQLDGMDLSELTEQAQTEQV